MLRCFEDENITHVEGGIDPIPTRNRGNELMLADLESLEKRVRPLTKKIRGGDKDAKKILDLVERGLALLKEGKPARMVEIDVVERKLFGMLRLLTAKPILYICNVDEDSAAGGNQFSSKVAEMAKAQEAETAVIEIEEEVAQLESEDEKRNF